MTACQSVFFPPLFHRTLGKGDRGGGPSAPLGVLEIPAGVEAPLRAARAYAAAVAAAAASRAAEDFPAAEAVSEDSSE